MVNHPNRSKHIYVSMTDKDGRWFYSERYGTFCNAKYEATASSKL